MEKEIKYVLNKLTSKTKLSKIPEIKDRPVENFFRDRRLPMSYTNVSRRTNHRPNYQIYPRPQVERVRRFGLTNDSISAEQQTFSNELIRLRIDCDQNRIVENVHNQSFSDQNTR